MTQPTTLILLLALTTVQVLGQTPSGVKGGQGVSADFFTQKILPVLQQKCFNCHQTGRKMKGGLAVDSQAALITGGDSGPPPLQRGESDAAS